MMTSRLSTLVGNNNTSHLLVGIASFASELIEYKYIRTYVCTVGHHMTTVHLAWISGPRVTSLNSSGDSI